MTPARIVPVLAFILVASCGRVAELKPAPGHHLPVKPLMARATPTPNQLLAIPPYAKPDRVDELMKRSEPRPLDPYDLPPPTGGAAPSLPAGSESLPSQNPTQPAPGMPVTPPPTTPGE